MAQNIWDDAFRNTLQKASRIEHYLKADHSSINRVGGQQSLTPLAGACYQGHLDVVELLITHGARPDIPCPTPRSRTALYYAIVQAPKNQVAIVKALLTASYGPADPNETYPEDDNATPLSLAIEARDKDIVRALIDAGATPTAENRKQAQAKNMARYLMTSKSALAGSQSVVDLAVATVSLIISYTDGGALGPVTKGFLSKMYNITCPDDNPVAADIPEPKSAPEFKHNINNFVKAAGLDKFYTRNPTFIQSLAEKAAALRDDPTTDLGNPENIKRLTQLSLYQLVIYCDDSGSMTGDYRGHYISDRSKTRYYTLCQLVSRIARVATSLLPEDAPVKVRFINNPFQGNLTVANVHSFISGVQAGGGTPLGSSLVEKILRPLVYDKMSDPDYEFEQPLLVCVITDGAPNHGDLPIKQAVLDCRRALVANQYDADSVLFCINQIGEDQQSTSFLESVRQETEIRDVVYCTTDQLDVKFAELRDNERQLEVWLLEMLTKPIMRDG
ncbi:hypothetical protein BJ165DRAFT_166328 [Panaeolus papilionaceus]|nr:hypothetical protein BJ165DRAFT_166328 [Panaeolus papilionaceus]